MPLVEPQRQPSNPAGWTVDEQDEDADSDVLLAQNRVLPPSSFQRPRKGTVASFRSGSMSGLTSASEEDTDAEDFHCAGESEGEEEVRTAAIVVAEEGRGLILHGEGMSVGALNIQPGAWSCASSFFFDFSCSPPVTRAGTTHLLLASLASSNSLPQLLTQTLPSIASTLLALDISANFLGALPPALAACTQLTELNIASNPLRALPVWLSGLEGLRVLIADATGIGGSHPVSPALLSCANVRFSNTSPGTRVSHVPQRPLHPAQ